MDEEIYNRGEAILRWCQDICPKIDSQICPIDLLISWKDGKAICAMISYYRPELLDYNTAINLKPLDRIELALRVIERVSNQFFLYSFI